MGRWFGYGARGAYRNLIALVFICFAGVVRAETATVAVLGDSLIQGYGLVQQEGLVPQLESWLHAQGADVALINAGVSGDTTQGGLSRIAWTLTPEVDAVIVALGGNDLLRGIDPAVSRANIEGIVEVTQQANLEVLLIGIEAPLNYGADYKAAFDAIFPQVAEIYGTAFHPGLFTAFDGLDLQDVMQSDSIHPNAKGVSLIVEEIGPDVLALINRIH
ncbi:arylesterase [Nereida sp. MMG025]|uniref:arylesterase n=1 Tax=Nereida sp. MMG025 TaxID=2909981 RepID=UPI001F2FD113|nr:arylesterase [Nereida sp. MMG025]MCF6445562.1 arylesterase [Nereida sp. MMG025]